MATSMVLAACTAVLNTSGIAKPPCDTTFQQKGSCSRCCAMPPLHASKPPGKTTEDAKPPGILSRQAKQRRKRVFFLDVAPLCYRGNKPQPSAFLEWIRLLFLQVTDMDPIIAVMDGERGNEYRRNLFPSYKANRNTFVPLQSVKHRQTWIGDDADLREAFPCIITFLNECNVPVVRLEDAEADDVVASLTEQANKMGMHVAIASPDKDFKQMLCQNVQLVIPNSELGRWSFYTYERYIAQHNCEPTIELGLRCILGDSCDNIPGLADLVSGIGRNTALKLMKRHGSLENLLDALATRTIGKPYIQNAFTTHNQLLWRNLQLLSLRRDLPIVFNRNWCFAREKSNDFQAFLTLERKLEYLKKKRVAEANLPCRY